MNGQLDEQDVRLSEGKRAILLSMLCIQRLTTTTHGIYDLIVKSSGGGENT